MTKNPNRIYLKDDVLFGFVPSPGEVIQDELSARKWTLAEFADRMGYSVMKVRTLMDKRSQISIIEAENLGRAFGTSPEFWISLEKHYRLWEKAQN